MEDHQAEDKIFELRQAVDNASAQLALAKQLLAELGVGDFTHPDVQQLANEVGSQQFQGNTQIVEGVFNGQNMVGPDGKIYTVPANYASKSKLVEGDILKLSIQPDGSFIYKQIGPVERQRIVGTLIYDDTTAEYVVSVGDKTYKVIKASVTYYKGKAGDQIVILTPQDGDSVWAAVENIIKDDESISDYLSDGADAQLPAGYEAELPAGDVENDDDEEDSYEFDEVDLEPEDNGFGIKNGDEVEVIEITPSA